MKDQDKLYIDGQWVPSTGSGSIDVINASTEEVMGRIPEGTADDVDRAVAAAKAAFETWSQTSPAERGKFIQGLADALGARNQEIAETICGEVGMPMFLSQLVQAGLPAAVAGTYVGILDETVFEEQIGNSLVIKEPVGVVGCITPWNYPLHQIVAKVAPALAAGCTVVLKPSEVAPLNAFILAEIIDGLGLPAGVFNLVTGTGPVVGEAIAAHPDVDMVSFTGSTRAGQAGVRARGPVREAGGARARRQVRQHPPRRPRGRGARQGRPRRRRQLLPQLRPDLHRVHPHARAPGQARRDRRHPARRGRDRVLDRRPVRRRGPPRPADLRRPARPRAGLHREGRRRGRHPRHRRRRAARGSAEGLLRQADGLRRTSTPR